jgi:hypothetical protein
VGEVLEGAVIAEGFFSAVLFCEAYEQRVEFVEQFGVGLK